MDGLFGPLDATGLALAFVVTLIAGVVKGMVGFAMPMLMITGLTLFLDPQLALAALILPTLVANGWQALRQGLAAALTAVREFWLFLLCCVLALYLGAQLVTALSYRTLFLMMGGAVSVFALIQLLGGRFTALMRWPRSIAVGIGTLAGFVGGFSGIWGPPTVIYLTLLETEKRMQMRVQGVIYGISAVMLLLAHLQSGVFRAETAPLSALLLIPALAGMALGTRIQDRIDQRRFRMLTLVVLGIGGLNLIRRGLVA